MDSVGVSVKRDRSTRGSATKIRSTATLGLVSRMVRMLKPFTNSASKSMRKSTNKYEIVYNFWMF